jgi:hypothetical protein
MVFSCAGGGTELTKKQKDKTYSGKTVSDILVIVIADQEKTRRNFEQKFVVRLKDAGVDAVSSAEVISMPSDLKLKKAEILKAVEQYGNDAVMITHLAGLEDKEVHNRINPGAHGYHTYYDLIHSYVHDPGYSTTRTTVRLETNLYDVATEKLIWSGQTKSWNVKSESDVINDVIDIVVNELQKSKLLAP